VRSSLSCANTCMSFGRQGGVADASPQCRAAGAIVAPRCCGGGYGLRAECKIRTVGQRGRFAHELMIRDHSLYVCILRGGNRLDS
jgi:hypothetical protein